MGKDHVRQANNPLIDPGGDWYWKPANNQSAVCTRRRQRLTDQIQSQYKDTSAKIAVNYILDQISHIPETGLVSAPICGHGLEHLMVAPNSNLLFKVLRHQYVVQFSPNSSFVLKV